MLIISVILNAQGATTLAKMSLSASHQDTVGNWSWCVRILEARDPLTDPSLMFERGVGLTLISNHY